MTRNWLAALSASILFLLMAGSLRAQSDRGAIAGSVSDSSGAAISGASITLRGVDTGSMYKTQSTSAGTYRVNDVAIGRYDVTVEAAGFKESLQKALDIQINSVAPLNVILQPGDVKEVVTVLADAPKIQTDSSDIGTVVEDKQIHDLPLSLNASGSFARSPETFIFLVPGTIGQGTVGQNGAAGVYETKISGGQNFGSEVLLDGASAQRSDAGTAFDQTAPSIEALTEFKVTTSTPSAQFGHTSGGVESFTTKSGTNRYHGSVFELFRNEALDANSWTNDFNATSSGIAPVKPRDRQNDFGGSLGGPVRIPYLYDGHDKTFFFFVWEQYRNRRGLSNDLETLPTPAERGGDFSGLVNTGLNLGPINPCTPGVDVFQGEIFDPSTTQLVGGQTCRMPFAGNKITNLSPVAQKVLGYMPNPNATGLPANGVNGLIKNYLNAATLDHVVVTQMSFRIDENLTEKSKLFFSYHSREQPWLNGDNFDLPVPLTPGNYYNYYFTHYLRFGWDYVASPSVLNHLAVGFNRVYTSDKPPSLNGSDWDQVLGIPGASGPTFPQMTFNGAQYGIGYSSLSNNNYNKQVPNALVVADSVSWMKGRHSFRFGFDWRSYQYSATNVISSPNYTFSNNETSFTPPGENVNSSLTGDPYASFLLGLPDNENLTVSSHVSRWAQNYYATYVQDDVKVSKALTVNAGLRWEIETPRHEAIGAQSVLSLTASNPASPGTPGALIYGKSATGATTYFKDLGPRIGFAYAPDFVKNTVFRGAYSIYYAPLTYSDFGYSLSSGTTVNPTFQNADHFTPVSSLDVGFPAYTPPSDTQDPTLNTFNFNGVNYVAPSYGRPGMVQNWDVEIQHQLATDLIFSIGYVGQHATRLRSNLAEINNPDPKYNYLGSPAPGNTGTLPAINYLVDGSDGHTGPAILAGLGVTVPSWFIPAWAPQGNDTIGQLLRPFPQYWNFQTAQTLENLGQSTYNGLQTTLERRFRNGLNLLASYTYSKTITDADSAFWLETAFNSNVYGGQNPYNLKGEKAVSYQDVPHAFVVSYMYEFPAGPGKRFFTHGVASKVVGGWQISGVHRYQSGAPTVIHDYYGTGNPYTTAQYRLSLVPGQPIFNANGKKWTPALSSIWNSGCTAVNGIQTANQAPPGSPPYPVGPANCAAFEDPSAVSINAGTGYAFGDIPSVVGWWRSPWYKNEDFSILKRTTVSEGKVILFKLDIPNAFNRHTFGEIDGWPGDTTFGVPQGVINAPRQIQATLRYEF